METPGGRKLTAKFREELARQDKGEKTPETLAAGETAQAAGASLEKVADAAVTGCKRPGLSSGRGGKRQDSNGAQRAPPTAPLPQGGTALRTLRPYPLGERMRQAAIQGGGRHRLPPQTNRPGRPQCGPASPSRSK